MSCSSYQENYLDNNSSSDCAKDPYTKEGRPCLSGSVVNDAYDVSFCTFYHQSGNCSSVCGCDSVYRCYADCSNYASNVHDSDLVKYDCLSYSSSSQYYLYNNFHNFASGNVIDDEDFKDVINKLNSALDSLKLSSYKVTSSFSEGDIIKASDLKPVKDNINDVWTQNNDISGCNRIYHSDAIYGTVDALIDSGKLIKATDWSEIVSKVVYLSTCCSCDSNFKAVCETVCMCSCYY